MKKIRLEDVSDEQLARALTNPIIDLEEDEEIPMGRNLSNIDDNTLARALTEPQMIDL
jgi:hypothetical protein